jgi:hypothetical protein
MYRISFFCVGASSRSGPSPGIIDHGSIFSAKQIWVIDPTKNRQMAG